MSISKAFNKEKFKIQIHTFSKSQSKLIKILIFAFAMFFSMSKDFWGIGFFIYLVNLGAIISDFNRELSFFLDLRYTRREFYINNYIIVIIISTVYSLFIFYLNRIGCIDSRALAPIKIIEGKIYTYLFNLLSIVIINVFIATLFSYFICKEKTNIILILLLLNIIRIINKNIYISIMDNIVEKVFSFWGNEIRFYILLLFLIIIIFILYKLSLTAYKERDVN